MAGKAISINTNFLIQYVHQALEKRMSKNLPEPLRITNEWEHFEEIDKFIALIARSLSFRVEAEEGVYPNFSTEVPYNAIESLYEEFIKNKSFDLYAHIFQPRYRAHFTHNFLVGALGWWALENIWCKKKSLKEHYISFIKKTYDLAAYDVWDIWWTVALLHDIGYPLSLLWKKIPMLLSLSYNYPAATEFFSMMVKAFTSTAFFTDFSEKIKKSVENLERNIMNNLVKNPELDVASREAIQHGFYDDVLQYLHRVILPFRSRNAKNNFVSIYHKYLSDDKEDGEEIDHTKNLFKSLDHGIISSILIYQHLKRSPLITRDLEDDPIVDFILNPIAFHNLKKVNEKILEFDMEQDFDVFFLRLIDQLQEWGRGIMLEKSNEFLIESRSIQLGPIEKNKKDKIDLERLEITYTFNNYRDVLKKSGWSFGVFNEDKQRSFQTLKIYRKIFEPKIKIEIVSEDSY